MQPTTALIWSWLNVLTKKRYDQLVEAYGNMEAALEALSEEMLKGLGCREETMMRVLIRKDEFDPDAYAKELAKRDLRLLSIEDEDYPAQLKEIGDPPIFLYVRGDLSILKQPCIALVGTREMSAYGKRVTEDTASALARSGVVSVSGLAIGVDAQVAKSTIAANGKTVAVLGHGLAQIFPKSNAQLAEEIVQNGGLLISEFPLDAEPDKYTFPARNRIIAGLSLGTVVLEAGEGSGALITAELALEYCRDVFAVPGQVYDKNYAGCHQLISTGQAKLVQSPMDILQEYSILSSSDSAKPSYVPSNPDEESVYSQLTSMPQSVSEIMEKAKTDASMINATLTMMELQGAAKNVGGGMWVRV